MKAKKKKELNEGRREGMVKRGKEVQRRSDMRWKERGETKMEKERRGLNNRSKEEWRNELEEEKRETKG